MTSGRTIFLGLDLCIVYSEKSSSIHSTITFVVSSAVHYGSASSSNYVYKQPLRNLRIVNGMQFKQVAF